MDAHKNFAYSTVATAPSPAASGTSLVVAAGHGTRFPAAPFNATVWPANAIPTPANAEIVRVTAIATDTLTIARAQESGAGGPAARTIVVGDQIAATITVKTITDLELQEQTTTATGTQNNFDLNGPNIFLRCTGAAPVFSGFTVQGGAPFAGCRAIIECIGGTSAKHTTEDAGSTAANRIIGPSAAGQIVGDKGRIRAVYDATSSRWRAQCIDPGAPLSWTPNDASGASLTFTNVSGSYQQQGRLVHTRFDLKYPSTANGSTSSIGGLPFAVVTGTGFAAGFTACSIPMYLWGTGSTIAPLKQAGGANLTNAELTLAFVGGFGSYFIA